MTCVTMETTQCIFHDHMCFDTEKHKMDDMTLTQRWTSDVVKRGPTSRGGGDFFFEN